MAEIGHVRGGEHTYMKAVRKARRLACERRETVRFYPDHARNAWVIVSGKLPKGAQAVTSVAAARCRKGKR